MIRRFLVLLRAQRVVAGEDPQVCGFELEQVNGWPVYVRNGLALVDTPAGWQMIWL